MIWVTGDTHGEQNRLLFLERDCPLGAGDILLVCGDFGYLWTGDEAENAFLDRVAERDYTLCFIDGNHENFDLLNSYPREDWKGGRVHRIRRNIFHLMRGQVFKIEGKTFFTMGGAFSPDRMTGGRCLPGVDYWEEEIPSEEEIQMARENLARHGNRVDYVLTHTAPKSVVWQIAMKDGFLMGDQDRLLTDFLDDLKYDLDYRHWYFGHFHDDRHISETFTLLFMETERIS